jgi:hypothetical protein
MVSWIVDNRESLWVYGHGGVFRRDGDRWQREPIDLEVDVAAGAGAEVWLAGRLGAVAHRVAR